MMGGGSDAPSKISVISVSIWKARCREAAIGNEIERDVISFWSRSLKSSCVSNNSWGPVSNCREKRGPPYIIKRKGAFQFGTQVWNLVNAIVDETSLKQSRNQ